jgi:predicted O-methyltransferase YrrM
MPDERWTEVDHFLEQTFSLRPEALEHALEASERNGLPAIQVSPAQGKLLHILALGLGARRILEIGTLGGYSAIWLAMALPEGGQLVTLERDERHAEVARANLAAAGLGDRVEVRVGLAAETLAEMIAQDEAPVDLVFIDADKTGYTGYLKQVLKLAHPGTLIIADNVVRKGAVSEAGSADANVQGVRAYLAALAAEPGVSATTIQTVGVKGYDGLAIAVVLGPTGSPHTSRPG